MLPWEGSQIGEGKGHLWGVKGRDRGGHDDTAPCWHVWNASGKAGPESACEGKMTVFFLNLPRTKKCCVANISELKRHDYVCAHPEENEIITDRRNSVCKGVEVGKRNGPSPAEVWRGFG